MSDSDDVREEQSEEAVQDVAFQRLLEKLSSEYSFDFREYKQASLARRIRLRMQQVRAESFDRYVAYLERHPDEHVALFNTILINVTGFFRDPEAWRALKDDVLPRLIAQASESRGLRLWCAGSSSGEEPYTAAILLAEQLGEAGRHYNVKIYATDVDEDAMASARHGLYRVEDTKDVPTTLLDRYFVREGQAYRFRRDIRRWVIFGRHNVVQDPPLSHIDLLICRNVLIYFTADLQEKILARFQYAIREGGYLFLGRSESLLARSRWFTPWNVKWRIFQRSGTAAPTVAAAMLRNVEATMSPPPERLETEEGASRLQRVVDALPAAVMVIDLMDNILVWNAAAELMFDIPPDGAIGRKFRDLEVSYRVEGLRARIEEVKVKQIPAQMEDLSFARRSGQFVHADIAILPLLEGNRITGVVVFATEATEHVKLKEQMGRVAEQHATAIEELQSTNEELETTNEELQSTNEELETTVEELQAANAELATLNSELERRTSELKRLDDYQRTVLSSIGHAIVVLDANSLMITWNATAERMWGIRADQVVGRPFANLPIGDITRLARDGVERVLKGGAPEAIPSIPYVVTASGETRHTVLRLVPLANSDGGITGVVAFASPDTSAS